MKMFICILAVGLLLGVGFLRADSVDVVSATWTGSADGLGVVLNQVNGTFLDIRWGIPVGGGQSGLGFDGIAPPPVTLPALGNPFLLGTLRHYNQPISGDSAATSADLSINANLTIGVNPLLGIGPFNFRFLIDETPNVAGTCAYTSTTPCADKITFNNLVSSDTFMIGTGVYTMSIVGFAQTIGGGIVSDFISQEGGTSTAYLYAAITPPAVVPEPASILGLGTVLLLIGSRLRRSKA